MIYLCTYTHNHDNKSKGPYTAPTTIMYILQWTMLMYMQKYALLNRSETINHLVRPHGCPVQAHTHARSFYKDRVVIYDNLVDKSIQAHEKN